MLKNISLLLITEGHPEAALEALIDEAMATAATPGQVQVILGTFASCAPLDDLLGRLQERYPILPDDPFPVPTFRCVELQDGTTYHVSLQLMELRAHAPLVAEIGRATRAFDPNWDRYAVAAMEGAAEGCMGLTQGYREGAGLAVKRISFTPRIA